MSVPVALKKKTVKIYMVSLSNTILHNTLTGSNFSVTRTLGKVVGVDIDCGFVSFPVSGVIGAIDPSGLPKRLLFMRVHVHLCLCLYSNG